MDDNRKLNIISEGQKYGVTLTCKKYNISRTLYYRWLKKYKTFGVKGLASKQRNFTPVNKTSPEIESIILNLIKKHPSCGPREIKYILESFKIKLSESAVYNIIKRNNLNTKYKRVKYAKRKEATINKRSPNLQNLQSGDCWFFWTTFYGNLEHIGPVYEYTIFDYKSRIACTRLYDKLSVDNFEDILSAIAIPVAQSLSMHVKHLCLWNDIDTEKKLPLSHIHTIFKNNSLDISLIELTDKKLLSEAPALRQVYTHACLSYLIPLIHKESSFKEIKLHLQNYIRNYNIHEKQLYDENFYSPIEYHISMTKKDMILPLWAYMYRDY